MKPIPSAPGYFATIDGHIVGLKGNVLCGRSLSRGYLRVYICSIEPKRFRPVHSLVCEAFHGPRPIGYETAHGDGVRTNNRPDNLRWATPKENSADMVRHGTSPVGERNPRALLTAMAVIDIRRTYVASMGAKYVRRGTREALAKKYGVSIGIVKAVISGDSWAHIPDLSDPPFGIPL